MITKAAEEQYKDLGYMDSISAMSNLIRKDGKYKDRIRKKLPYALGVSLPISAGASYAAGKAFAPQTIKQGLGMGAAVGLPIGLAASGYMNTSAQNDILRESDGEYRRHPGFWKGKYLGMLQKRQQG